MDAELAAIFLNIYCLAIGFTIAGAMASGSALVTGEPLKFEMSEQGSGPQMLCGAIARIIAGPFMIVRNTFRAIKFTKKEPYWVMVAIVIASLWSFCQGVLILETFCSLGACA